MKKNWYQSKGKIGAVIVAVGSALGAIGGAMQGTIDWGTALNTIIGLAAGLGIWGVRDAQG